MLSKAEPLDAGVRDAYLARLGLEAEPPSATALRQLMNRHAERVPYETLWIAAGEAWDIDPHAAAVRIALEGRGGYCYHVNGAFGLLLSSLGYHVHAHTGGVHGPDGPSPDARGNHLVVTISELPSEECPDGIWYVDTGLGDAMHDPWPLRAGPVRQPPFLLSLEDVAGESWQLTHDPSGGFRGMTWTPGPADTTLMEAKHHWLSTSPESGFVQVPMAQRRDATGVDVMRGLVPMRTGDGARTDEPLTRRGAWFDMLADRYGLRLDSMSAQARDRLWETVRAAHDRWERSKERT